MGLFDFKRYDGFVNSVPQHFIDKEFPLCPMCGTNEPYWKLKSTIQMMQGKTLFLCDKCGAVLSATTDDISDSLNMSNASERVFNMIRKKCSGKNSLTVYMKVEEVGKAQITDIYKNKELSIEELKALADSFK